MTQVLERVRGLISREFNIPLENISIDSKFSDLGLDSLDAIEHAIDLEWEFGFEIPEEDALKIESVRSSVECVIKQQLTCT